NWPLNKPTSLPRIDEDKRGLGTNENQSLKHGGNEESEDKPANRITIRLVWLPIKPMAAITRDHRRLAKWGWQRLANCQVLAAKCSHIDDVRAVPQRAGQAAGFAGSQDHVVV